ncbi:MULTISPECIES: HpcH/HpaI aldolase/citrate lyase family protein [unclassified Microbacterium]|uniref:HpcH/HpaI aldolase family protein n=1 Tax=unclassified Microbacterium TaxID=2609290 RepID=UPI00364B4197
MTGTAPLLAALRAGVPQLMLGVRMSRTTDIARIAASTGFQCLMIDLEHSTMSVDVAAQLAAAAGDLGLTSLVRVPEREYGMIGRLLDGGAHGIIAPRVETAAQARLLVEACRFPPRGHRSQLTQLPQLGMVPTPGSVLAPRIEATTIVKVLIESPAGVDAADEIAAVDGIDIVGIGANDLTGEYGVPGEYADPAIADAFALVLAAARAHDRIAMVGGVPNGPVLSGLLRDGFAPMLLAGMDSDLVFRAAAERVAATITWHTETMEDR